MDLWIRSQNKKQLSKSNKIYIKLLNTEYEILSGDVFYILGSYKTKERALEVLDEIQRFIIGWHDGANTKVYEMPEE